MIANLNDSNVKTMTGRLNQKEGVALEYMLAGNATFTIVDTNQDIRFTYKVNGKKPAKGQPMSNIRFCSLMRGVSNESDFSYFGFIKLENNSFIYKDGKKSKIKNTATSVQMFKFVIAHLRRGAKLYSELLQIKKQFGITSPYVIAKNEEIEANVMNHIEIFHEGSCGRCGRKLTVPESVDDGIGPECKKIISKTQETVLGEGWDNFLSR